MSPMWSMVLGALTLIQVVQGFGLCGHCRLDICFVVDESGSSTDDWDNMKGLMFNIVSGFDIGPTETRIGVVKFNGNGELVFDLNDYFDQGDVLDEISGLSQSGAGTNIAAGINRARSDCFGSANGEREDAQSVMIVISDGIMGSVDAVVEAVAAADAARGDGIAVIAIGTDDTPDEDVMDAIGDSDEYTLYIDEVATAEFDYIEGAPAVMDLLLTLCSSECMANVCFVIDGSGSVDEWPNILSLMINFVNDHTIGFAGTLVGVVQFNSAALPVFDLVEHLSAGELTAAIGGIIQAEGGTDIAEGIDVARTACFGAGHGARSNARNVMIVVTDGDNNAGTAPVAVAADNARNHGITVIAYGVETLDLPTIQAIAGGDPQYDVFNLAELGVIYGELCRTLCRVDFCFVVDESGSIQSTRFDLIKDLMSDFVSAIEIGDHDNLVAVVEFNHDDNPTFDLDDCDTTASLLACIAGMDFAGGNTDIGDGVDAAREYCFGPDSGNRPFAPNVMIVVSDGGTMGTAGDEADAARADGTTVVTIGVVTSNYDPGELNDIADGIAENMLVAGDTDPATWNAARTDLIEWYYRHWCCNGRLHNGLCGHCRLDVCFVVDESGSNNDDWINSKRLMRKIVRSLPIGPTETRVGVVKFNGDGELVFDLNDYYKKYEVLGHIAGMDQSSGGTDMATGINKAMDECFGAGHGNREDAQDVLIVISDGMTTEYVNAVNAARDARNRGIAVVAIAVDEDPNEGLMLNHIGYIDEYTFFVDKTSDDYNYITASRALTDLLFKFCSSECMADTCLVVDQSGSNIEWPSVIQFLKDFVESQHIGFDGSLFSLIKFNESPSPMFNKVKYLTVEALTAAIGGLTQVTGSTNIAAAISYARINCYEPSGNAGARSNARNVMMVVTDGKDNQPGDPVAEANLARDDGITVIVVGLGASPDSGMIEDIAGEPQYSFYSGDYSTIGHEVAHIYAELCRTVCRVDMCFVVDESGSVNLANFNRIKDLMSDFVEEIEIGNHDNLVGVVEFNHVDNPTFDLDDCDTEAELLACIAAMTFADGNTNIGEGIEEARSHCFGPGSGNRPFAPNVMYVVTDGLTQNPVFAIQQADLARDDGTTVVTIGIATDDFNAAMLDDIAGGHEENQFLITSTASAAWDAAGDDILHWYNEHWCCKVYCRAFDPYDMAYPLRNFNNLARALPYGETKLLEFIPPKQANRCNFKVVWDRPPLTAKRADDEEPWMAIFVGKNANLAPYYRTIEFERHPFDEPTQSGLNCPGTACPVAYPPLHWYPHKVQHDHLVYSKVHKVSENNQYDVKISPVVVEHHCSGVDKNPKYHMSYYFQPGPFGYKMQLAIDKNFYEKNKPNLCGYCLPAGYCHIP